MAVCESCPNTRETLFLFRSHVVAFLRIDIRNGTTVRTVVTPPELLTYAYSLPFRWVHIAYTLQALYLLPLRAYTYKKRAWHYFLFDLCYYATVLNFIYIWLLPSSPALFVACYCLSHGSLASAVITWRNSLVFHDSDKVTSLFIHIYAPFTFTVIRSVARTV